MEMNINNLRTFVNALNDLPDEVKNNKFSMMYIDKPVCNTVSNSIGCDGGLISVVANYVPELKSLYPDDCEADCYGWADTLAEFLGFDGWYELKDWAHDNPELWGNPYGYVMFDDGSAFGEQTDKFKHSVVIDHWTGVLKRVENKTEK